MKSTSRKPAIALILLVGCIGLIVCGVGGFFLFRFWDVDRVAARADSAALAYRAAGLPWEARDVILNPPPESQNAAEEIRQAIKAFDSKTFLKEKTELGALASEKSSQKVGKRLKRYELALSLAGKASTRPRLDFHRDWDQGPALLMPEMSPVKYLVNAFCIRAEAEANEPRSDRCLADLRSAAKLAALIGQDSTLIAMLVEIACDSILYRAVEVCGYALRNDSGSLVAMRKIVDSVSTPNLKVAFRGEAYMGVATFRNYDHTQIRQMTSGSDTDAPTPPKVLVRTGLPPGNIERAWATVHLELWTRINRLMSHEPLDPIEITKELDRSAIELDRHKTMSNLLEAILMPIFSQAGTAVVKDQSRQRTTSALLAAIEIRARTGKFPSSLAGIPGKWIDQFTKGPLKYKLTKSGVRVYSVGADGKDHGGVAQRETTSSSEPYDIVAAYPPIKPRR